MAGPVGSGPSPAGYNHEYSSTIKLPTFTRSTRVLSIRLHTVAPTTDGGRPGPRTPPEVPRPPPNRRQQTKHKLLAPIASAGGLPPLVIAHPASFQPAHVPAAPHSGAGAPAPWTGRVVRYPFVGRERQAVPLGELCAPSRSHLGARWWAPEQTFHDAFLRGMSGGWVMRLSI
jgi:hypothetical protein